MTSRHYKEFIICSTEVYLAIIIKITRRSHPDFNLHQMRSPIHDIQLNFTV
ncbi:hypothetical protein ACQFX9_05920 [Aliinostoc sp. HNIBRCY26]|uniref:hypothetical protein n=1 Tax=Aliinostoc sp. HNIBRCY26 TaxID=3418997 RepID=UPI003CFF349D